VEGESTQQVRKGYIDIIRNQLTKLTLGIHEEQDSRLLKLTPTEMKICQFIQAGSSTKDIAESMCLSMDTILTHRKNIRKKLGLRGRHVNLFTFLNSPEPRDGTAAVL
jgi:DNA-binding NarL/FixJ family response regulator